MPGAVLNISCYRFVALDGLPALRLHLLDTARTAGLTGTVLLAEEGINLFLAGRPEALRGWLNAAGSADARLAGLQAKESWTGTQPFRRLKVKIKPEIIRMNLPMVRPEGGRAPSVSAATLARWLDRGLDDVGRPVVVLDTRNAFEVEAGAFRQAVDWGLGRFSEFPAALAAHRGELVGKTVVSYCTGGIRCEKAVLLMHSLGLADCYQLEGGILKYFEQTEGAPHWRGGCFVFDERGLLDAGLQAGAGC